METVDTPYVKLTKTPLAQDTSVCGAPARPCTIILALFALVVIAGTHIVFGILILELRASYVPKDIESTTLPEEDANEKALAVYSSLKKSSKSSTSKASNSHMTEEQRIDNAYKVAGGSCIASGIILTITGIVFLVGAIKVYPQLFEWWYFSMLVGIGFGRILPILCSWVMDNKYLVFLVIMLFVDIILLILFFCCWAQMAAVYRNKRYMVYDMKTYINNPSYNVQQGSIHPPPVLPREAF